MAEFNKKLAYVLLTKNKIKEALENKTGEDPGDYFEDYPDIINNLSGISKDNNLDLYIKLNEDDYNVASNGLYYNDGWENLLLNNAYYCVKSDNDTLEYKTISFKPSAGYNDGMVILYTNDSEGISSIEFNGSGPNYLIYSGYGSLFKIINGSLSSNLYWDGTQFSTISRGIYCGNDYSLQSATNGLYYDGSSWMSAWEGVYYDGNNWGSARNGLYYNNEWILYPEEGVYWNGSNWTKAKKGLYWNDEDDFWETASDYGLYYLNGWRNANDNSYDNKTTIYSGSWKTITGVNIINSDSDASETITNSSSVKAVKKTDGTIEILNSSGTALFTISTSNITEESASSE